MINKTFKFFFIIANYLIFAQEFKISWLDENFLHKIHTVDSLYLGHPLSRTSLCRELKSRSLCVGYHLFFSLYLELSLSRINSIFHCEFEIERVNWIETHFSGHCIAVNECLFSFTSLVFCLPRPLLPFTLTSKHSKMLPIRQH